MVDSNEKIIVSFGDSKNKLEIVKNPFSFEFFVDSAPAISFNSRDLLYFEPYRSEQSVPPFALQSPLEGGEDQNRTEEENILRSLRDKIATGLGSEDFNGKTDSKPKGT